MAGLALSSSSLPPPPHASPPLLLRHVHKRDMALCRSALALRFIRMTLNECWSCIVMFFGSFANDEVDDDNENSESVEDNDDGADDDDDSDRLLLVSDVWRGAEP